MRTSEQALAILTSAFGPNHPNAGVALSNKVAPAQMTAYDRQQLTWALGQIGGVRDLLGTPGF